MTRPIALHDDGIDIHVYSLNALENVDIRNVANNGTHDSAILATHTTRL